MNNYLNLVDIPDTGIKSSVYVVDTLEAAIIGDLLMDKIREQVSFVYIKTTKYSSKLTPNQVFFIIHNKTLL
ncbi:hypothetical protein [Clostridium estertheticum]|uniref:hypothetical protein n=1 Tax=Clostridium estertheticum TaxID=238834 RepID=UPI001CF54FB1|nr:hypothetical protein [Clostridium estertheticum]MCB2361131.1 hypothetical protein [Clostridium estertheticum]